MRGGERKGAGRKSLGQGRKVKTSITIRPDHSKWLKDRYGKVSRGIERAIDQMIKGAAA